MSSTKGFDLAVGSLSVVGLVLQIVSLLQSGSAKPLVQQWEEVSSCLHCEVSSVLQNNRNALGDQYPSLKDEYDKLQDSIQMEERRVEEIDLKRLSSEARTVETRRVRRAHREVKHFKDRIVTTSREKRGASDTMSFSESIRTSTSRRPKLVGRVFARRAHRSATDEEATPSGSWDHTNGSQMLPLGNPNPDNSTRDPIPGVPANIIDSLDVTISVHETETGIIFHITDANGMVRTITDKEFLRDGDSLPQKIKLAFIAFGRKVCIKYPTNEEAIPATVATNGMLNRNWSASLPNLHPPQATVATPTSPA